MATASASSENVAVKLCDYQVRATKDWTGEELDDLSFKKDDLILVRKEDGAGWASGMLKDGSSGWFPLDCVELVHESAIADIGTQTGAVSIFQFYRKTNLNKVLTFFFLFYRLH